MIVDPIKDRHGRSILTVRDQNTFAEALRQKRLMTLIHLWLIHRFKADAVYYVTPTEDNLYQTEKMKSHGIFRDVYPEVGEIIVADVNHSAHRRAAGARSRGAAAVDSQGRLDAARNGLAPNLIRRLYGRRSIGFAAVDRWSAKGRPNRPPNSDLFRSAQLELVLAGRGDSISG